MSSLPALDRRLLMLARTRGHGPRRERAVAAYSRRGEHAACWLALGLIGATGDDERRGRWVRGAGVVGSSYVANGVYFYRLTVNTANATQEIKGKFARLR